MSYLPYAWFDGTAGGTPITAVRLNAIEQGITNAAAVADAAAPAASGRNVTAATTIDPTDDRVVYTSSSAISQALPVASTMVLWKTYTLSNSGTGVVTITTSVAGAVNRTLAQWATLSFYTDGTNYLLT